MVVYLSLPLLSLTSRILSRQKQLYKHIYYYKNEFYMNNDVENN